VSHKIQSAGSVHTVCHKLSCLTKYSQLGACTQCHKLSCLTKYSQLGACTQCVTNCRVSQNTVSWERAHSVSQIVVSHKIHKTCISCILLSAITGCVLASERNITYHRLRQGTNKRPCQARCFVWTKQ